jgi:transposase
LFCSDKKYKPPIDGYFLVSHNLKMYIREVTQKNKKTGEVYSTCRLVESYRNAEGKVRQQVLLNLGSHFQIPKEQWKILADRVEEIRNGQKQLFNIEIGLEKEAQRISKLVTHRLSRPGLLETTCKTTGEASVDSDYQMVDLNSMTHRDIRKIGGEHVGYHAAKQLRLPEILAELKFNQKQVDTALGNIIGRLVHPGSELSTHRYLTEHSGLDELLGTDFSKLPLKNLYRISDKLLKHKDDIEKKLYLREKELFQLEDVITLFDITNTYFEGRSLLNPKGQLGRSKEKRSDCPLVALGMILDSSGFPKKSEVFPGNVSEPGTLEKMLNVLNGNKKVMVVMDAGIATEGNIQWLKASGYEYVVVSRKRNLVMPSDQEPTLVKNEKDNVVKVSLVKNEETNELELYCKSGAKQAKSKQMVNKAAERFETELKKLNEGLLKKRSIKKSEKILERLGRLKEKHKRVAFLYHISVVQDDENKQVIEITWQKKEAEFDIKQRGIYCLRTSKTDLDADTFWNIYTMLTDLEAAFRSLKSELGFRPVYHQKEDRVDGHLFISVLAYHLLHTIRYQLKIQNIHESWESLRELLDTQCRITTSFQLKGGKNVKIRKTSFPDTNQMAIYKALKISTHPGKTEKTYA